MKNIKKVILTNFQSHKKTEIDFDKGLNIIVGPSDSGKTSIIRGIKWALYNDPLGDFFIRKGETETSVEIHFNDNIKVKRFRSSSKNMYQLTLPTGESMDFEGFGHNVPDEILRATGISQIELDGNISQKINLAEQLEGAFLLSESDYVKANSIGRLVGVNIIDDALRKSLTDLRSLTRKRKDSELRKEKIIEELKGFEYLGDYEIKLNKLKETQRSINKTKSILDRMKEINIDYDNMISNIEYNKKVLSRTKNLDKLEHLAVKIQYLVEKKSRFQLKLKQLKEISNAISIEREAYLALKDLELAESKLLEISNNQIRYDKLKKLKKEKENNESLLNTTSKTLKSLDFIDKSVDSLDKIEKLNNKFEKINNYYKDYIDAKNRLDYGNQYIEKFEKIDMAEVKFNEVSSEILKLKKLLNLEKNHNKLKKEKTILNEEFNEIENQIKVNLDKYENVLSNQESCPLCLSTIDNNKTKEIIISLKEEFNI